MEEEPAITKTRPASVNTALASELFPVVYDELRKVARRYLARERRNHTLQPTALVHEAWLRLRKERRVNWNGRTHVLAIGAQAMRRLSVDHGRRRKRVNGVEARSTRRSTSGWPQRTTSLSRWRMHSRWTTG